MLADGARGAAAPKLNRKLVEVPERSVLIVRTSGKGLGSSLARGVRRGLRGAPERRGEEARGRQIVGPQQRHRRDPLRDAQLGRDPRSLRRQRAGALAVLRETRQAARHLDDQAAGAHAPRLDEAHLYRRRRLRRGLGQRRREARPQRRQARRSEEGVGAARGAQRSAAAATSSRRRLPCACRAPRRRRRRPTSISARTPMPASPSSSRSRPRTSPATSAAPSR